MTFVVYKDYQSGKHHIGWDYILVDAKSEFEMIDKAEEMWKKESNKLYLMRIMKKVGKVEKLEDGWKKQRFEAVMCKRSAQGGWHMNTQEYAENYHAAYRTYKKDLEFFDAAR